MCEIQKTSKSVGTAVAKTLKLIKTGRDNREGKTGWVNREEKQGGKNKDRKIGRTRKTGRSKCSRSL